MKVCVIVALAALAVPSLFAQARSATTGTDAAPPVPSYCSPCLFYSGDFDPLNPNAYALANGVMLLDGEGVTAVYVPFVVPSGQVWTVRGLFLNELATVDVLDPARAEWSISSGVSSGQSGTVIASGSGAATLSATGRSWNGMDEYTVMAEVREFQLQPGTYWMSVLPQCTNKEDAGCEQAAYFATDVEDNPPQNFKGSSPANDSFWYYPRFNDYFRPTSGVGGACNTGCNRFSAGIVGVVGKQAD